MAEANKQSAYTIKFGKRPLYVLIAAILGAVVGYMVGPRIGFVEPLGLIFIRLLKFVVGPIVLISIAHALTTMTDFQRLGRVFGLFIGYWAIVGLIASTIGYITASILKPGIGMELSQKGVEVTSSSIKDIILSWIPQNAIQPLLELQMIQIIVMAILFGISIALLPKAAPQAAKFLTDLLESLLTMIYKVVDLVLWYAPIGVFCLIANLVGTTGGEAIKTVAKMVATQWVAYGLILLVLHPLIMLVILKVTPFSYWRKMAPAMITGFAIQSSSGTLPVTLSCARTLGVKDDTAEVILPIAATINMQAVAAEMPIYAIWAAQMYGVTLSPVQIGIAVVLGVFGAAACAGVPGGGIMIAAVTLQTLGLPLTAVGWIAGVYIFIDILNTMTNITGDPLGVMVVSHFMKEFDKDKYYSRQA